MKKKKYILSEKQKEQNKITRALKRANRTPEEVAKNKIYQKEWAKKNPDYIRPCKIENPDYDKETMKRFHKANPDYVPPCVIKNPNYREDWNKANPEYQKEWTSQHDLGYWVVYLIHNYNGLGDTYCGQTGNVYNRMKVHKSDGRLNTETHELIKQCETLRQALDFEAYMHEQGYHGRQGKKEGK